MAEYIEREALIKEIASHKMTEVVPDCYKPSIKLAVCRLGQAIKTIIKSHPAADVVEVRHGTWLDAPDDGKPVPFDEHYNEGCVPQYSCYCSVCGEWLTASDEYAVFGRYCPNCGAKMDGKDVAGNG